VTEPDPRPKTPPESPESIDADFDDFDEAGVIGSGGNADVTKVSYSGGGPEAVALKQPRIQGTMDADSVSSFVEEAETWDKIDDHDHIVGVLDWDSEPVPWIALEYMDGGSLQDRLGELSVAEALWVGVCLCRAVRHAHRRGIAHLDLKPENVLFRETDEGVWDYPKVADWGLAKMLLEHSKSVEGMSPKYAAPEQFDEETYGKPDDFTDIYAVGAVVYAALTGEPPFEGTAASVMQSVLNDEPVPPSERVDGLPEGTDEVVLKALEKRKGDRYESILDLRRELEELVEAKIENKNINRSSNRSNQHTQTSNNAERQKSTPEYRSDHESSNEVGDIKRDREETPSSEETTLYRLNLKRPFSGSILLLLSGILFAHPLLLNASVDYSALGYGGLLVLVIAILLFGGIATLFVPRASKIFGSVGALASVSSATSLAPLRSYIEPAIVSGILFGVIGGVYCVKWSEGSPKFGISKSFGFSIVASGAIWFILSVLLLTFIYTASIEHTIFLNSVFIIVATIIALPIYLVHWAVTENRNR
jgi:serine/threonine protein kinase